MQRSHASVRHANGAGGFTFSGGQHMSASGISNVLNQNDLEDAARLLNSEVGLNVEVSSSGNGTASINNRP